MSRFQFIPRTVSDSFARYFLFCFLSCGFLAITAVESFGQATANPPQPRLIYSSRGINPAPATTAARPRLVGSVRTAGVESAHAPVAASSLELRVFELINQERVANGEPPLVWDAELCRMAREHSEKMVRLDFINHVGPDGLDMVARAHANGISGWRALGENIAYNQGFDDPAAFAVERWMKSTKHRSNILRAQFTHSAIGIARDADGGVFFTQVFMTP